MTTTSKLKGIQTFVSIFGGSFKKLDPGDVDYKVFDASGALIAYAEVCYRPTSMRLAYPLPVPATKVVKLISKRIPSVVIWVCEDGIIYGRVEHIAGTARYGSAPAMYDKELMVYYDKQRWLKYVRFTV